MSAKDTQEGGSHYKDMDIQPWDAMACWATSEQLAGYYLCSALAYLARFNVKEEGKGGLVDVKKARHYLDSLIEHMEERAEAPKAPSDESGFCWLPHDGKGIPSAVQGKIVCVNCRDGWHRPPSFAETFRWHHDPENEGGDIIAYKVIKELAA